MKQGHWVQKTTRVRQGRTAKAQAAGVRNTLCSERLLKGSPRALPKGAEEEVFQGLA